MPLSKVKPYLSLRPCLIMSFASNDNSQIHNPILLHFTDVNNKQHCQGEGGTIFSFGETGGGGLVELINQ